MRTGLQSPVFDRNRIVSKEDLGDHFLEYYRDTLDDLLENILYPEGGLFQAVSLIAAGANKFSVSGPPSPTGMADGHILDVTEDPGYCAGVQFENAIGIEYGIALGRSLFPVGVEISTLDGQPRIEYLKEIIGSYWANPGGVTDNLDGTLTMVVDTVTEVNVSNAGRYVLVLKYPDLAAGATEEDIAWQVCLVSWSGTQNEITTSDSPAGAGYFGQATPSTSNSQYQVCLLGPYVSRNFISSMKGDSNFAFLGTVIGTDPPNPPAVFDTTEQNVYGTSGIAYLSHITRIENVPPDRLKIDVKALADEENTNTNQISVQGWNGAGGAATVFTVDELGNVFIWGDLQVQGESLQQDLVTIQASEIITDSLTLGDADSDHHLVKGEWQHRNVTDARNVFVVDGATGHIGVGGNWSASYDVVIYGTGDTENIQLYCTPTGGVIDMEANTLNIDMVYLTMDITTELSLVSADDPQLGFWDEGEGVDEKRWGIRATAGSFFVGVIRNDAGAWGTAGIEIGRTGTTLGNLTLKGDYIGLEAATQIQATNDLVPSTPETSKCGDSSNYWLQSAASEFFARGSSSVDPTLTLYHSEGAVDEKYWQLYSLDTGTLVLISLTDALVPSATTGVSFTRTAEDMTQMKVISPLAEFECSTKIVLDSPLVEVEGNIVPLTPASAGSIGIEDEEFANVHSEQMLLKRDDATRGPRIVIHNEDTDIDALNHRWEVQAATVIGPPDRAKLKIVVVGDTGGSEASAMEFDRSGLTPTRINTRSIYPLTGSNVLGDATDPWQQGTFSDKLVAKYLELDGDPGSGGAAGTVRFTNATVAVGGSGDCPVTTSSGAGTPTNTEWLKLYLPGATRWMPLWTSTT